MNWRVTILISMVFMAGSLRLVCDCHAASLRALHEIYVNGTVLTMDASDRIVEAVSVRNGRIDAVGGSEALLATADDQTSVVDLRGRTLMPGFVDAHGHFPGSGQTVFSADLNSPPIGEVTTMAQLLSRLKAFAAARSDGWVVGHGYDDTLLLERAASHSR